MVDHTDGLADILLRLAGITKLDKKGRVDTIFPQQMCSIVYLLNSSSLVHGIEYLLTAALSPHPAVVATRPGQRSHIVLLQQQVGPGLYLELELQPHSFHQVRKLTYPPG